LWAGWRGAELIEAPDDEDAIKQAEAVHPNVAWELWHCTRLVEKLWG